MSKVMKIETKSFYDDVYYDEYFALTVDGDQKFCAGGGEPEDNSLGRDLSFVTCIDDWMVKAFEHGRDGGTIEVTHRECKTRDEFWED